MMTGEDNDYSDNSDGWVNTGQSDSSVSDNVSDNEGNQVIAVGWIKNGKRVAYSDVKINANNVQNVRIFSFIQPLAEMSTGNLPRV
jgi:hypothetical protein